MLKLKRKSGLGRLLQLKKSRETRILARYALYTLALASLVIALCGIVYLGTILVISLFVGRIIATGEGLILAGLTILGASVVTYLFADLALRVEE